MTRFLLLLITLNAGIYASNAYDVIDKLKLFSIKPVHFYLFTVAITAFAAIGTRLFRSGNLPTPFLLWLGAYFSYLFITFLYSSNGILPLQALITGIEMGILWLCFTLLFQVEGSIPAVLKTILVISVISAFLNFYDFAFPTWTSTSGRAAGLHLNPNASAVMLNLSMVACVAAIKERYRLAYCLLIGAAVLLTFSRGGWLAWGIAIAGLIATGVVRTSRLVAVATLIVSITILYLLFSGAGNDLFTAMGLDNHLSKNVLIRLADPLQDNSADERVAALKKASEIFSQHPFLGAGLGSTAEWDFRVRPHNMYLYLAAEGGILGVFVFLWLLTMLWHNVPQGTGRVLIIVFAISSLFSHANFEKPEVFVILTLLVAAGTTRSHHNFPLRQPINRRAFPMQVTQR